MLASVFIDKNQIKKRQSDIKVSVQTFGKLLLNWMSSSNEFDMLLNSIMSVYLSMSSISATMSDEIVSDSNVYSSLCYRNVGPILLGKMRQDLEAIYVQVKQFM